MMDLVLNLLLSLLGVHESWTRINYRKYSGEAIGM